MKAEASPIANRIAKHHARPSTDSTESRGSPPACPAMELSILEGMLPNQDWSMVDWTTVMKDGPEYIDDFGKVLLEKLGMLGMSTVSQLLA